MNSKRQDIHTRYRVGAGILVAIMMGALVFAISSIVRSLGHTVTKTQTVTQTQSQTTAAPAQTVTKTTTTTTTSAHVTPVVPVSSSVSIQSHGLTFSGTVTSPSSACVIGRRVTLYRTNGILLGSMTTGPSGHWTITASGSAGITLGNFFAKVNSQRIGTPEAIHVCAGATSLVIPYK